MDRRESLELSDYAAMLRRRWLVILLATVLGGALSALYMLITPKSYQSWAQVQVTHTGAERAEPGAVAGGRTNSPINLDTEAQIVKSALVGKKAKDLLKVSTPPERLSERVSVEVVPNSVVMVISFTAGSPTAAQQGAHAFAQAYLDYRKEAAQASIDQQIDALQQQVKEKQEDLRDWQVKLTQQPANTVGKAEADAQVKILQDELKTLHGRLTPLQATEPSPGQIITDANRPTGPSNPVPLIYLASGLMAGLVLGLIVAVLIDRSDKRVRNGRDLELSLALPVLLEVPLHRPSELRLLPSRSRSGQAFHELAHSLIATLGQGNHVVLVTGATAGPGCSMVAVNVAAALARTEASVVLVCADLYDGRSPRMLGLTPGPGLAEVLLDTARLQDVEQHPHELPQLRVVPPGLDGEMAYDHLQRHGTERLVQQLRRTARHVVIEAPSTAVGADVLALAHLADVAIIVVETPKALRAQVREGVRQIDRMGAAVLGAVVLPALGRGPDPGYPAYPTSKGKPGRQARDNVRVNIPPPPPDAAWTQQSPGAAPNGQHIPARDPYEQRKRPKR